MLLRDTLGRLESTLGGGHPDTLRVTYSLGSALLHGGSADEGVAVLTSTHDVQVRALGPTHDSRHAEDAVAVGARATVNSAQEEAG